LDLHQQQQVSQQQQQQQQQTTVIDSAHMKSWLNSCNDRPTATGHAGAPDHSERHVESADH